MLILKKKLRYIKTAAALVCAAVMAGCGNASPVETTAPVTTAPAQTTKATSALTTPAPVSNSAAALESEGEPSAKKEQADAPLVIAADGAVTDISPFYANSAFGEIVGKTTGVTLSGLTRAGELITHGKIPQIEMYGGKGYAYGGIADIDISRDEESGITVYDIKLRDDVRFADGEKLDADDVIFTLYLHLDTSYNGDCPLYYANIVGALNYCFDSSIAETITAEAADEALADEGIAELMRERLIIPVLEQQYTAVEAMYDDSAYSFYTAKYKEPQELFAYFYSLTDGYEAAGKDRESVIAETADAYGINYRRLAGMITGDETAYDTQALSVAVEYITRQSGESEPVHVGSVSGIVRKGDLFLSVSVRGDTSAFENALCGMRIVPLHYYGSTDMYDYAGGQFGFTKGNAGEVLGIHATEPLGAGAYRVTGHFDGALSLEANEYYYKGEPATKHLKIVTGGTGEAAYLIRDGIADVSDCDGTGRSFTAVDEANRSMEKILPVMSGDCGYGYIGINAENVKVGDDCFSDKSYALRRGIATAIAFYKEESVLSYYGEHCEMIDYPIIDGVVPETNGDNYVKPFTVDVNGAQIFTDGMTEEERYEAVKKACLGFFGAAGYEITDGSIVTGAPEGGKLEYTADIVCGSDHSHPAYKALENASELLGDIGITLDLRVSEDAAVLWDCFTNETQEIWAGAWAGTLRQIYLNGYYSIASHKLEELVETAENASAKDKPKAYMECLDRAINVYAAEIPLYMRRFCTLFSTIRVDVSSVTENMTETYGWTDEIDHIRLKKGQQQ